jgi:hypothetical protein
MSIAYSWKINQLNATIAEDGLQNVIYTVHYTYTGTDLETPSVSASTIGTMSTPYVPGTPFVSYEDTQAFENIVIGWLMAGLPVMEMQLGLANQIELMIKPVDEDLYFTWMNPPIPPIEKE